MLYSICSMQFWINKSNLVCAENDLSTHLCIDCILSGWKDLQTDWKTYLGKKSVKIIANCRQV